MLLTPCEHLLIAAAREHARLQGFILDPEEMAEASVKAFAEELVVIVVQFAARVFANLVERSWKEIKAAKFRIRADGTLFHARGARYREACIGLD